MVLAALWFRIHTSKTEVAVWVAPSADEFDLVSYLEARRDSLSQVAKSDTCDLTEGPTWRNDSVIWTKRGGWRSDVDWRERVEDVRVRTPMWVELFHDLPQKLSGKARGAKPESSRR